MAVRFKKTGKRNRHFIAEWRRHRHLSQAALASRLETSTATLSRIENGLIPYSQDFIEAAADALNIDPGSLIMRNPEAPDAVWSIADRLSKMPEASQRRALAVIDAIEKTETEG